MTLWSPTSTLWLVPCTSATVEMDTGLTVTVADARTMPSTWTPACSAQRTGILYSYTSKPLGVDMMGGNEGEGAREVDTPLLILVLKRRKKILGEFVSGYWW